MSESVNFSDLLEQNITHLSVAPGDIVTGVVEEINDKYVIVNAGLKSESFIHREEFYNASGELTVGLGDSVDVAVEAVDDGSGYSALSYEKAKRIVAWAELEHSQENDEIIDGEVMERVKGGFTVMVRGIKAFLPGSLADMRPIRDPGQLENQTLQFKVVKMDPKRNNIVVSRRAVIESETSEERAQLLSSLQEGMEVSGMIKNLTDYGAFVDLGGIDGLLHITDMAWRRVKHPSEVVEVGQEITVKILSFDQERQRVSLGLKQMIDDPWHSLTGRYPVGSKLFGVVTNITDYGCFVEIESGVEGLVHMSEMDWTNKNIHPSSVVKMGQEIEVMILEIDEKRRRISLGIKQCSANPWSQFSEKNAKGDVVTGVIKSITDFGLFIGLPGGIDGLVHHTDLSWNEPGEKVIRNYKKGEEVTAIILSIDAERERVSLGVKQLSGDKIANFLSTHPEGSEVKAVFLTKDDRFATFSLDEEVQGQLRVSDVPSDINENDEMTLYVAPEGKKGSMILLSKEQVLPQKSIQGPKVSSKDTSLGSLIKEQLSGDDA